MAIYTKGPQDAILIIDNHGRYPIRLRSWRLHVPNPNAPGFYWSGEPQYVRSSDLGMMELEAHITGPCVYSDDMTQKQHLLELLRPLLTSAEEHIALGMIQGDELSCLALRDWAQEQA